MSEILYDLSLETTFGIEVPAFSNKASQCNVLSTFQIFVIMFTEVPGGDFFKLTK